MSDGASFKITDKNGDIISCEGNCSFSHDPTDLALITEVTTTEEVDGSLIIVLAGSGLDTATLILLKNDDRTLIGTINSAEIDSVSATFMENPSGDYDLYLLIDDTYFAGFESDSL